MLTLVEAVVAQRETGLFLNGEVLGFKVTYICESLVVRPLANGEAKNIVMKPCMSEGVYSL